MAGLAVERNSKQIWLPPWTRLEHEARYDFASSFVAGKRVVDCACGTGIGSRRFASSGAVDVHAIDSSKEAVAEARAAVIPPNLLITEGDAAQTGLRDNFADVFISLETIEHIQRDAAFVEEVYRVLKPDGLLICSTPNREITNPGISLKDKPWNPHHVREYSLNEFKARLESRFVVEEVYGQNPVRPSYRRIMQALAKSINPALAVKMNKLLKCRWFLFPQPEHHAVRVAASDFDYEFYVLVCRKS